MGGSGKTKQELIEEVNFLRTRLAELEQAKKGEEEVRKFKTICDRANYGVAISDLTGNLLYVNEAFAQMHGYPPDDLIGLHLSVLHTDEQMEGVNRLNEQLAREGSYNAQEVWHRRTDGSVFCTLMNATVIKDERDKPLYLSTTAVDITERKQVEEALRESEVKHRTLLENLPQKIFYKNLDSVYISCNNNYAQDLGIKPEEIAGRTDHDFFPEKLAQKYRHDDKRIIESGKAEALEEKYVHDGEEFIVQTLKTPVRGEKEDIVGILGVFWDITERRRIEAELRQYREKKVQAERLAALGIIGATLAHQLNQPLTVIRLILENSQVELQKTSVPKVIQNNLKEGLSATSQAETIVKNFRQMARLPKPVTAEVDLQKIAEYTTMVLAESSKQSHLRVVIEDMSHIPRISGDPAELEQIFFMLTENAIQAAEGKKNRKLTIQALLRNNELKLIFADDCGGIDPAILDKIFDPFITTKPPGRGMGMGLNIVQDILTRRKGAIQVENRPNQGATFLVTMPW